MKERAYAKINLSLNVLSRRADGYHELESLMLPLDFYDELEMNVSEKMSYSCNKKFIYFDEKNTICKAISLFKETYAIKDNFSVVLNKRIPMQAGLGGGSADAAAVFRLLQRMYHITMSEEEVKDLSLKIGADVVFTYYNKPALVSGIGERMEFTDIKNEYYCLLLKPRKGVSTKECYQNLDLKKCDHPDISLLREKLAKGEEIEGYLGNSLEESAVRLCEDILQAKQDLIRAGAHFALMSGSGSTIFTLSRNADFIKELAEKLKNSAHFVRFSRVRK